MGFKSINTIVEDVIKNNNWDSKNLSLKEEIKREIDKLDMQIEVERFEEEVIILSLENSIQLQELNFKRTQILRNINKIMIRNRETRKIRDIKFIIRKRR